MVFVKPFISQHSVLAQSQNISNEYLIDNIRFQCPTLKLNLLFEQHFNEENKRIRTSAIL